MLQELRLDDIGLVLERVPLRCQVSVLLLDLLLVGGQPGGFAAFACAALGGGNAVAFHDLVSL